MVPEDSSNNSPKWGLFWIASILAAVSVSLFVAGVLVALAAGMLTLAVAAAVAAAIIAVDDARDHGLKL